MFLERIIEEDENIDENNNDVKMISLSLHQHRFYKFNDEHTRVMNLLDDTKIYFDNYADEYEKSFKREEYDAEQIVDVLSQKLTHLTFIREHLDRIKEILDSIAFSNVKNTVGSLVLLIDDLIEQIFDKLQIFQNDIECNLKLIKEDIEVRRLLLLNYILNSNTQEVLNDKIKTLENEDNSDLIKADTCLRDPKIKADNSWHSLPIDQEHSVVKFFEKCFSKSCYCK